MTTTENNRMANEWGERVLPERKGRVGGRRGWGKEREREREREKGFAPWDYIISSLGKIRHFFKITNQLTQLS